MSSSDKKGFTGTAIVLLGLFGVGGAMLDRMRNSDDETEITKKAPVQKANITGAMSTAPAVGDTKFAVAVQKPDFEAIKLAEDGTGLVTGKATPSARIIVEIDGKGEKEVETDANGDFSVELNKVLTAGTHVLEVKARGPNSQKQIAADRRIKIDLGKGRDAVVSVLEEGQDPMVLPGSSSTADGKGAAKTRDRELKLASERKLVKEEAAAARKLAEEEAAAAKRLAGEEKVAAQRLAATQKFAAAKAAAEKLATEQNLAAELAAAEKLEVTKQIAAEQAAAAKLATAQRLAAELAAAEKLEATKQIAAEQAAAVKLATEQRLAAERAAEKKFAAAKKLAVAQKMVAAKKGKKNGAAEKEWWDISFTDMSYLDKDGKSGEIRIVGKAQSGAKLRFLMDGKAIGAVIAGQNGAWSFKAKRQLERGAHWLVAERLDANGKRVAHAEVPFDRADEPMQVASNKMAPHKEAGSASKPSQPSAMEMGDKPRKALVGARSKIGKERADKGGQNRQAVAARPGEKSLWTKFKGIFKVDPNAEKEGAEVGTKVADKDGPAGVKIANTSSGSKSFTFETVEYQNGSGGAAVTITGRGEPGARIRLYDGGKGMGEAVVNKKGQWSFKKAGQVKAGMHEFQVAYVLKTGREMLAARMQYDHVLDRKKVQDLPKVRAGGMIRTANGNDGMKKAPDSRGKKKAIIHKKRGSSAQARQLRRQARKLKRARRARAARKYARSKRASRRQRSSRRQRARRKYYALAKRTKPRTRTRRISLRLQKSRKARRARAARLALKKRGSQRYYLGGRNRRGYWVKRGAYAKNGRLRRNVRIYKGNSFYGYGRVRSGNGRVVVRIKQK